jgi:DMSO/TMAO reductase YedYZ molybdopterin-dependent catalytic subunit
MKKPLLLTSISLLIAGLILASASAILFTAPAASSNLTWQLSVEGLVNTPSNFSLTDLEAMPQTTVSAELYCVDYPNTIAAQGNWTGVKLSTLLDQAGGIQSGAIKVGFYASDGFTTDLTIDSAKSDNVILAYAKDGVALGEVLRLVVPGHWGYKWIAEVVTVKLVNYDFLGRWESTPTLE